MIFNYPDYVDKVIEMLEAAGFEAFVVGGGLRDIMLGREPYDFDVTTSATPDEMLSVFSEMRTIPTGLSHGTLTVLSDGKPVEVTTYRIDGEYHDARHPDSVEFTKNICDDLSRRDFTVNAMAYNKKRGLVDPFGGQADLGAKILRAVGTPEKRMREDALRIMRALRFEAQLGFSIEENTERALSSCRDGLSFVSGERRGIEFLKLATAKDPASSLKRMKKLGISDYVLGYFCPDEKIIDVLSSIPNEPHLRFGTLLSGADENTARNILRALKYSNAIIDGSLLVLRELSLPQPESEGDMRRSFSRLRDDTETVASIRALLGAKDISADLKRVRETGVCYGVSDLAISGSDLIALGLRGKAVGEMLECLFELVCDDPSKNTKNTLLNIAKNQL